MKRNLVVRSAALAAGAGLAMSGLAACTVPTPAAKTTFQMYANVDAEGDLGSNFDAVSASLETISPTYVVTFTQPIGHCAAAAQAGKAGGPDIVNFAESVVLAGGAKSFVVGFKTAADGQLIREPFMLTVTCSR